MKRLRQLFTKAAEETLDRLVTHDVEVRPSRRARPVRRGSWWADALVCPCFEQKACRCLPEAAGEKAKELLVKLCNERLTERLRTGAQVRSAYGVRVTALADDFVGLHVFVFIARQSDFNEGLCRDFGVETKLADVEEKVAEATRAEMAALAQEESRTRWVMQSIDVLI
jgi:hypothetical protein